MRGTLKALFDRVTSHVFTPKLIFSFLSQAGKGNKPPSQQYQKGYYSTSRSTIKRKIAILRPLAEKQRAFAYVKQTGSNGQHDGQMLQIRLKTGIDREQFRPSGQKSSKKPPRYGMGGRWLIIGLQRGTRENIILKRFLRVYFLNQYKYWFDNNLKCEGFGGNSVAVSRFSK